MNDLSNESTFTLEEFPLASSSPKKKEEIDEDPLLPPPEHKATFITSQKKALPPLPPRPYSPPKRRSNMTVSTAKTSPQKSPTGSKDSLQLVETETSSTKAQGSSSPSGATNIDESITTETFLNDSLDQIELSRREIDQVANELSNAAHSPPIPYLDSIKKYLKIPCSSRKAPFTIRGGAEKALVVSIDSVLHPDLLDKIHPGDILFTINNE